MAAEMGDLGAETLISEVPPADRYSTDQTTLRPELHRSVQETQPVRPAAIQSSNIDSHSIIAG